MFDQARRIFDLLSDATLPPGEGDRLLIALKRAIGNPTPPAKVTTLRVDVEGPNGDGTQSARIPLGLVHTGLKFAAMLPGDGARNLATRLRSNGITVDFSSLSREQLDAFVDGVRLVTIHVPAEQTRIHITAE